MSCTSHSSAVCGRTAISDVSTTVSEDDADFQDEGSEDGSNRSEREFFAVGSIMVASGPHEFVPPPPQRTPTIPSMSSLPPPPPACFPRSSFEVSRAEVDELVLVHQSGIAGSSQLRHNVKPAQAFQQAAGSFTDLCPRSLTCASSRDQAEDRFGILRRAGETEMSPQTFELSRGSALHDIGKCKPCAFVHRPVGCMDGASCAFCHMCAPGEKKRRQKSKLDAMRFRRELRRMVIGAKSAEASGGGTIASGGRAAER